MPNPSVRNLTQKAVLWTVQTHANEFGQQVNAVSGPVEIRVRWENGHKDLMDPKGNKIEVDAMVAASRVIPIGSKMWLGALADWYGTGSEGNDDDVMQVKLDLSIPNTKGRNTRRVYGLMRYSDTPE